MHIIIIGCGIAGLSCAIGFRKLGHEVLIVERATDVPAFGAGINISPNASRALQSLGVLKRTLQRSYIPAHASIRAWDTSELLSRQKLGDFIWKTYEAPFAVVHRYDLYRVLFEESRSVGVRITFSQEVVSIAPTTASVTTSDGKVFKGDLIVGADGERSVCREAIIRRPISSKDSGAHVYRFMIPQSRVADVPHLSHLIDPPCINLLLGPEGPSMIYAVKRDEMLNVVLTKRHQEMEEPPVPPHPVDIAEIQEEFRGWSLIQDLLRLSFDTPCTRWTLVEPEEVESWCLGKTVLIGDAAHVMTPFVGQGAAMAIEDAVVLINLIGRPSNNSISFLSRALKKFHEIRQPRIRFLQAKAQKLYNLYVYPNGSLQEQRDERLKTEMQMMESMAGEEASESKLDLGCQFARDSPNFLADVEFRNLVFHYDAKAIGKDAFEAIVGF